MFNPLNAMFNPAVTGLQSQYYNISEVRPFGGTACIAWVDVYRLGSDTAPCIAPATHLPRLLAEIWHLAELFFKLLSRSMSACQAAESQPMLAGGCP